MDFASITQWLSDAYRDNVPSNARALVRGLSGETSPVDEKFFSGPELEALKLAAARGIVRTQEFNSRGDTALRDFDPAHLQQLSNLRRMYLDESADLPDNEYTTFDNHMKLMDVDLRSMMDNQGYAHKSIDDLYRAFDAMNGPAVKRPHIDYEDYRSNALQMDRRKDGDMGLLQLGRDPNAAVMTTIGRAALDLPSDNQGNVILRDKFNFNQPKAYDDPQNAYQYIRNWAGKMIPEGKGFDFNVNLGPINDLPWSRISEKFDDR